MNICRTFEEMKERCNIPPTNTLFPFGTVWTYSPEYLEKIDRESHEERVLLLSVGSYFDETENDGHGGFSPNHLIFIYVKLVLASGEVRWFHLMNWKSFLVPNVVPKGRWTEAFCEFRSLYVPV